MRIAFIGTRGIPANYGGFETCVEELSTRLADRGHETYVICRSDNPKAGPTTYRKVRLIQVPRLRHGFASSPFNSFISTANVALSKVDIAHFFGCGSVPFTLAARVLSKKVVLTVDGLEWKRNSYSKIARMYLRSFAELAMVFPNITVADSISSQEWYSRRTGLSPEYIPYGTVTGRKVDSRILEKFHLKENEYILFSGRLVYEKGVHTLLEAFKSVDTPLNLVIVGDYPAENEYVSRLKSINDQRVKFLGYVYGREFETIRNGALIFVHPSLLDGTSISLLGAMGAGLCVLSSNIRENIDTAGEGAVYFGVEDSSDLRRKLQALLDNPERIEEMRSMASHRASKHYDWNAITDSYENLYERLIRD